MTELIQNIYFHDKLKNPTNKSRIELAPINNYNT